MAAAELETVIQSVAIKRLLKPPLHSDAPLAVFWDFENCSVPADVDPDGIASNIRMALRDYGLNGPLSIYAYGNLGVLSRRIQVGLITSGVDVRDVPPDGKKETTDKRILTDLMLHACDTPPPAHILLISGDDDFTYGLHRLALRCYHVHVALNLEGIFMSQPSLQRLTASGRAWQWQALLRGDVAPMPYTETLGAPKGTQQRGVTPRDRPSPDDSDSAANSAALEDSVDWSPRASRAAPVEPLPVPADVKTEIAALLDSAPPEGIGMSKLQSFLARKGFALDYRGLGYKQLLALMQAMPDVAHVTLPADRATKKEYYLRPAAQPAFVRSMPSGRTGAGALRADIGFNVWRTPSDPKPQAESAPAGKLDGGTADKVQLESQPDDHATRAKATKAKSSSLESRQKPLAVMSWAHSFRKVVTSIGGLLRKQRIIR